MIRFVIIKGFLMAKYDSFSREELLELLLKQDKELARKKYGLVWDSEKEPEKVVLDCAKKLPILKSIKAKDIKTNNDDNHNIMIEGDNYHALQVLNYTHKGKIDVIYIDPPYNTGNKDFIYNDKFVDKEDGYRHSKWLNFMEKRLELAKELLTDKGVIFISIDDNEQANLKLLCDKVFGENNFISSFPRITKKSGKTTDNFAKNNDYVVVYTKIKQNLFKGDIHIDPSYNLKDEYFDERGFYKLTQTLDYNSLSYSDSMDYPIEINGTTLYPGSDYNSYLERKKGNHKRADWAWRWSKELFQFGLENGFIVLKDGKDGYKRIYTKTYQNAKIVKKGRLYIIETITREKSLTTLSLTENIYSNDNAKKELALFNLAMDFDYPKPSSIIKKLLTVYDNNNALVLDFFAGSGTTAHAVLALNKSDMGKRHFILCTNNEGNIATEVCYPRIQKVINGYNKNGDGESIEGLGGNLKYFKTDFIANSKNRTQTKINLAKQCSEMLCLKTGIYNLINEQSSSFKIFDNNQHNQFLCIYFDFFGEDMQTFVEEVKKLDGKKSIFAFSLDENIDKSLFVGVKNANIEPIPQKILDVYRKIAKEHIKGENNDRRF